MNLLDSTSLALSDALFTHFMNERTVQRSARLPFRKPRFDLIRHVFLTLLNYELVSDKQKSMSNLHHTYEPNDVSPTTWYKHHYSRNHVSSVFCNFLLQKIQIRHQC